MLAAVLVAAVATAQPAETPAQASFREGRDLLEAGKAAEACAKFEESINVESDAPGTMLNLGLCNKQLGKTATALRWFRKAQFRSAENGMKSYEDAAKLETIHLASRVPTLQITHATGPVTVDGATIGDVDLPRLEIDPGHHVIESHGVRKEIDIEDLQHRVLDVAPPPPVRYITIDRGAKQRRHATLLAAGGGVLWLGCLTLSLVGKAEYDASEHPETWQTWQDWVGFGGTSLFVLGTAAVATGVYLYVRAPKRERVQVAPALGPDQAGATIRGSF